MACSLIKLISAALIIACYLTAQSEARYLPTRAQGDELGKLRELMLQILESSTEDRADTTADHFPQQIGGRSWGRQVAPSFDLSDDRVLGGRSKFGRYY